MFWKTKKRLRDVVVIYPWVAWSDGDTEKAVRLIRNAFQKEPSELDISAAEAALELIEATYDGEKSIPLQMVVDGPVGRSMLEGGMASHDEHERDMFGRKRYPEIVREIGFSSDIIEQLSMDFRTNAWQQHA